MKILMSVPSLALGGAERQFALLASGLAARGHEVLAVALGSSGPLADLLGHARLVSLGKASRWDNPRVALALAGLLRREAPAVHYAFLPSCCVLGGLLRPCFPATRLVFGVRAADHRGLGRAGRLLLGLEARLSARADSIIANSQAGRRLCLARGFPEARTVVVPNGFDSALYHPDRGLGAALRAQWGIGQGEKLIGLVARLDPQKDHATFLEAASLLARMRPEARFVCVGAGPGAYARRLRDEAQALGLGERLVWAGERADMTGVYNALDVLCLSSTSEGLPNVLGEAMSCGVPCVATDVGDAALLLGKTGIVVPPGDAPALAAGLLAMLERLEREGAPLGESCRGRMVAEYPAQRLLDATEALLLGL